MGGATDGSTQTSGLYDNLWPLYRLIAVTSFNRLSSKGPFVYYLCEPHSEVGAVFACYRPRQPKAVNTEADNPSGSLTRACNRNPSLSSLLMPNGD